jgi:hypothetical protein
MSQYMQYVYTYGKPSLILSGKDVYGYVSCLYLQFVMRKYRCTLRYLMLEALFSVTEILILSGVLSKRQNLWDAFQIFVSPHPNAKYNCSLSIIFGISLSSRILSKYTIQRFGNCICLVIEVSWVVFSLHSGEDGNRSYLRNRNFWRWIKSGVSECWAPSSKPFRLYNSDCLRTWCVAPNCANFCIVFHYPEIQWQNKNTAAVESNNYCCKRWLW